jgi:hypothetical protein
MSRGKHANDDDHARRMARAMTDVRSELDRLLDPGEPVRRFRALAPTIAARCGARIQAEVPAYAGPAAGRRRRLIELAITGSLTEFLDSLDGGSGPSRSVDELFRQMGAGEANDGRGLDAIQAAIHLAIRTIWESLRTFAVDERLPPTLVCELGDVLFAWTERLVQLTTEGHRAVTVVRERSVELARERLLTGLLRGQPVGRREELAAAAGWTVPAEVVVLAVDTRGQDRGLVLGGAPLVRPGSRTTVVVADAATADDVLAAAQRARPGARIALSWAIDPADVPAAHQWVTRALHLVESGVLPRHPVLRCADHLTQLWLHAEPVLRRALCQDHLRPLLAETPNSREILSETLLVWLETRDSAPAIAARLGVHPQTVRYRWKRINELFGDDLHDPEFVVQLTLLLKASVPLWKAGDQSDFERFRAQGEL